MKHENDEIVTGVPGEDLFFRKSDERNVCDNSLSELSEEERRHTYLPVSKAKQHKTKMRSDLILSAEAIFVPTSSFNSPCPILQPPSNTGHPVGSVGLVVKNIQKVMTTKLTCCPATP